MAKTLTQIHEEIRDDFFDALQATDTPAVSLVESNGAGLYSAGKLERKVKNLGWLVRNWRDAIGFVVEEGALGFPRSDVVLHAMLRGYVDDGLKHSKYTRTREGPANRTFSIPFASRTIVKTWLDRPIFRGLWASWPGQRGHTGMNLVIGTVEWRRFVK